MVPAWQNALIARLVADPFLASTRPTVVVAGNSAQMDESTLLQLADADRVAGSGILAAHIAGFQVNAEFNTVSGSAEAIEMKYPDPTQNTQVIERLPYGRGVQDRFVDQVYTAYNVSADGIKPPNTRTYDAEKKIFDAVHDLLLRYCQHIDVGLHEVTGTLTVTTGIRMCTSCYLVALQFLTNFPNLTVEVRKRVG